MNFISRVGEAKVSPGYDFAQVYCNKGVQIRTVVLCFFRVK